MWNLINQDNNSSRIYRVSPIPSKPRDVRKRKGNDPQASTAPPLTSDQGDTQPLVSILKRNTASDRTKPKKRVRFCLPPSRKKWPQRASFDMPRAMSDLNVTRRKLTLSAMDICEMMSRSQFF
uniref:Uncharacterized protein n=1 Tax=Cacopsylla melanoneura TaxID=428564 RepID=A0A8D9BQN3_9HEMI